MENRIYTPEEIKWNAVIYKRLHKIRLVLGIIVWCLLGLLVVLGAYGYSEFTQDAFVDMMVVLAGLVVPVMITCGAVSDSLLSCCKYQRCRTCGHVHIPDPDSISETTDQLRCPQCGKMTRHKRIPFDRENAPQAV